MVSLQVAEPDLAIETLCGAPFAFAAFWLKFRFIAPAARRVSSRRYAERVCVTLIGVGTVAR